MTLEQLVALAAVGRSSSLADAARRAGLPRTTLHRRIAALEAELGMTLLQRLPNGVALTPLGQRLADRGQALSEEVRALGDSLRDEHESAGTLRVAYPCGMHPALLTTAARTLLEALPGVRFRALPGPHADLPADADVCLHVGSAPPPGPFLARTIARVPVRLLAGDTYARVHGLPETVEAIDRHALLYWSVDSSPATLPLVGGGSAPVRPRVITPDLHFLHHAARAGLGLVFAVDAGLDEAPGVERLRPVLPDHVEGRVGVWVLLPDNPRPAPRIREAIRCLVALTGLSPNVD